MPDWIHSSLFWVVQIIILVGMVGLIIPIYPGTVIIWLAVLGYGIIQGFSTLGWVLFSAISLIMLGTVVIDNILMGAGARKGGASWVAILLALLAGIVGTLLAPPWGGLVAAPLAMLAWEYYRTRDWHASWKAIGGLVVGFGLTYFVRLGLGLVMVILWWVWVWKG